MKVAIMQPYFLPYIGYWQQIHAVDTFVIYDDVNYIKGGWINRNFILGQSLNKQLLTLQLVGASPNLLINQISTGSNKKKIIESIRHSYSKAPEFNQVFPLIEKLISYDDNNLARYLTYIIKNIACYLNIKTKFLVSSEIEKNNSLRGQDKVIEICKKLGANHYVNAIGGKDLYSYSEFNQNELILSFVKTSDQISYNQLNESFISNLSIIDILFFNSKQNSERLLNLYELQ